MTKTNEPAEQAVAKAEDPKANLALIKRDVVDVVGDRVNKMVESGQLQLPERYAVGNAIAAWWLALQACEDRNKRPALQVCTRDSIANATLHMVVQGLSPQKNQCYPIVYGNKLACQRSYFGDEAIVLRIYHARGYRDAKVVAEPIYQGDEFAYEIVAGEKVITKHEQKLANVVPDLNKILGGYCVVYSGGDLAPVTIIRTIEQIRESWKKSKTWKPGQKGTFHEDTPDLAVRRTVIRRACTEIINSSDDSYLALAVREADQVAQEIALEAEIEEEANGPLLALEGDLGHGETIDLTPEQQEFEQATNGEPEPPAEKKAASGQAKLGDPGF